jgi:hypothetical protein
MLELRLANPVWDDEEHEEDNYSWKEGRADRSTRMDCLSKSGEPIPWSGRLVEGEHGFEIRVS